MKKIISISVIALFAMIPTFGWAAFDGVASGSTDERVTETVPTNNSTTTYVTTRSSEADNDLTAAHGFQRAGAGVESIVTSQDPKYNVTQITEGDGEEVAALSFIKGAYNDAITKINKVYEIKEQTSGKFNLNTTWGGDADDVEQVSLITVNQDFNPYGLTPDDRCPEGFGFLKSYLNVNGSEFFCMSFSLEKCGGEYYDHGWVKGWAINTDNTEEREKVCFDLRKYGPDRGTGLGVYRGDTWTWPIQ